LVRQGVAAFGSQVAVPAGQVGWHVPQMQLDPLGHRRLQPPQWERPLRRKAHVVPRQRALPAGHAQEPAMQRSFVAHARSHAPQFCGSAWRSTQAQPHALAPPSHVSGAVRGHPSQYDAPSVEHPSVRAATAARLLCARTIAAEDIPDRGAP